MSFQALYWALGATMYWTGVSPGVKDLMFK